MTRDRPIELEARRLARQVLPPAAATRIQEWRLARFRRNHAQSACLAPRMQMHLWPNGDVRACCRNETPLGNITEHSLVEIWRGDHRRAMVADLDAGRFERGCSDCGHEVYTEGRAGSYPETFDHWGKNLGGVPALNAWPNRIEFNLSNACNLQCVQCNGDLSSAIRIHREGRPALPKVYDDRFVEDLAQFLPHLRHANFAGGEPFLAAENFWVWDLMAARTPDLPTSICTNATQWNDRVESVLDSLPVSVILSIDGITSETFEAIRVGAQFDEVLGNIERFRTYADERGLPLTINHCLMPQNLHEFADLLVFADERSIHVDVSVVRGLDHASIQSLPRDRLLEASESLARQTPSVLPELRLNRSTWLRETARIAVWAELAAGGPERGPGKLGEAVPVTIQPRPGEGA